MARPRTVRGFTLVEMMVTMSILAIVAASAAPSMTDFVAAQRVKSAASDLFMALQRARSEAIKRNGPAVIAPAGAWAGGWTVTAGGTTVDTHEPTETRGDLRARCCHLRRPWPRDSRSARVLRNITQYDDRALRTRNLSGQPVVSGAACA